MNTITSCSYICIVWITVCVCHLSAEAEFTVSGHVGSTVILPCELSSAETETPHIRWSIKSETVFERRGEEFIQGERYEGRVDVPEDQLRKRNCSLVLKNLTLTDEGVYKSYLRVKRTKRSDSTKVDLISSVYLSVDGKPVTPAPTGEAGMKCPHPLIMVLFLMLLFQL